MLPAASHRVGMRISKPKTIIDRPMAHNTDRINTPFIMLNVSANRITVRSRMISHKPRDHKNFDSCAEVRPWLFQK